MISNLKLMEKVSSPCIQVCQINAQGVCFGCDRTIEQITNWLKYSEEERVEIIKKLKEKK